jgi:SDR family mycofactocin-dependent oxidoreductase
MAGRLDGKVVFITGAARGQGRSHAIRLAQEGADIIAVDLCAQVDTSPIPLAVPGDLAETVESVEALGRRIVARRADVRDYDALKGALDEGVEELGHLDGVSANAAIGGFGLAHELTDEAWKDMLDVNLTGTWHTAKAAVRHLIDGGRGGSIVMTNSAFGLKGFPMNGHYIAAKHGVVGLMRTMAIELAPHFIRVNTLHPAAVATPQLLNEWTYKMMRPDLENPTAEDVADATGANHTLPIPWLEPVDISNALLFLLSDEARYVTGVTLPVDAGALLK